MEVYSGNKEDGIPRQNTETHYNGESSSKKRKRDLLEEIQNYIPEQYQFIKKRAIDAGQEEEEGIIIQNVESYYEKVALSSEKRRSLVLEEGEVDPGSNRRKNKKDKKAVVDKEKQSDCKPLNFVLEQDSLAPQKHHEENLNKNEEENLDQQEEDIEKEENEDSDKNDYANEPFPEQLTPHQKKVLLKVWKQRNFMDFNTWVQKSAGKLQITYENNREYCQQNQQQQEDSNMICQDTLQRKNLFNCIITLKLGGFDIQVSATSSNKKGAKKNAFENLFMDLADRNLIYLGIKYKSYIDYVVAFEDIPSNSSAFYAVTKQQATDAQNNKEKESNTDSEKISSRMQKLTKKIQAALLKDRFDEACRELLKMSQSGETLEWRWVCHLWGYCIRRKRAVDLKYIIDIMQYGRLKRQESEEEYAGAIRNRFHILQTIGEASAESVKISVIKELRYHYKDVVRIDSQNPFDYYDKFNVDSCNEQLPTDKVCQHLPEQIPRIFAENYHQNLMKCPLFPIKITKPIYNFYNFLTFSGSTQTQNQQIPQNYTCIQQANTLSQLNQQKPNTIILNQKEAFTNYLSLDMVQQLYDTLIFEAFDTSFALQGAEIIYRYAKIDPDIFLSPSCLHYYANRKVQMVQEMIEFVSNSLYFSKTPYTLQYQHSTSYITNIKGSITIVGTVYEKDVYLFYPIENAAALEKKLLKRNQMDGTQYHHQICEDEMVILTSFFKPTYDRPFMKKSDNKLVDYFNEKSKKKEEQQAEEQKARGRLVEEPESTYNKTYVDSITEYGNKVEFAVLAYVKEIQKDLGIKLYLQSPEKYKLDSSKSWKITKLCNLNLYLRWEESLTKAVSYQESMSLILNKIITAPPLTNVFHLRSLAETFVDKEMPIQNKDLNPQQYQTLLLAHRQCLSLIQAPNGSGKMRIVKRLIQMWHGQNSKLKVLLCVSSTDRMRYVYNSLKGDHIHSIEVSEKQTTKIEFTGLKTSVPDYEKTHNSMPRYYHSLKKALLGSRVVIINCNSANFSIMKGLYFQKVIILDSESLSEFSCLEAITKQCYQLVLIGDHLQQKVHSCNIFPSSRGACVSLFERLIREGIRPVLLSQNYRIPSCVLPFTSKYFYKNLIFSSLKPKPFISAVKYQPKFQMESANFPILLSDSPSPTDIENYGWPNPSFKINFIHVEGHELRKDDSIINMKELEALIHTALFLFKSKTIKSEQLCIITPYLGQKNLIIEELDYHIKNNPSLFNLEEINVLNIKSSVDVINVKTIDEVDKKYDLILLSTVRSNKEEKLGSLRDPRRLNAILSKTNEALIVIDLNSLFTNAGDVFTLDNDFIWREFITMCKEKGVLSSYSK